jgi:hypothetical protein
MFVIFQTSALSITRFRHATDACYFDQCVSPPKAYHQITPDFNFGECQILYIGLRLSWMLWRQEINEDFLGNKPLSLHRHYPPHGGDQSNQYYLNMNLI